MIHSEFSGVDGVIHVTIETHRRIKQTEAHKRHRIYFYFLSTDTKMIIIVHMWENINYDKTYACNAKKQRNDLFQVLTSLFIAPDDLASHIILATPFKTSSFLPNSLHFAFNIYSTNELWLYNTSLEAKTILLLQMETQTMRDFDFTIFPTVRKSANAKLFIGSNGNR